MSNFPGGPFYYQFEGKRSRPTIEFDQYGYQHDPSGSVNYNSNRRRVGPKEGVPIVSDFDDNTLQQVTKPIGDAGSAVEDAFESTGLKEPLQEAGRKIDDYLLQPAKDALLTGGGALVAQPSATRTTDSLFRDELFKFKEKDFGLVGRVEQAPQELVEDIDSNPFASDFDNRNLFG